MKTLQWLGFKPHQGLRLKFVCERAIHGKPGVGKRDFNFVAVSSGFRGNLRELERTFLVKDQTQGQIALWWRSGDRYYASHCYPSLELDPSGRPGLETQILEWDPSKEPAALGALGCLSRVASLTASDWTDQSHDPRFVDPAFMLPLAPLRFDFSMEELDQILETGIRELRKIGPEALRDFYAALLDRGSARDGSPAWLAGFEQPLAPEALAVLLLPAIGELAARWSLAGWPTERLQWHGIACASLPAVAAQHRSSADALERARFWVQALLANEPGLARGPSREVRAILQFARAPEMMPNVADLPNAEVEVSDLEEGLLSDALQSVLARAESVPEYMQGADRRVITAYRDQSRMKAEYLKAWWLLLRTPGDLQPWLDSVTTPGSPLLAILESWKDKRPTAARRLSQLA